MADAKKDIKVLLDTIIERTPTPNVDINKPFSMLISQTESNRFFGKMLLGRIASGRVGLGDKIQAYDLSGKLVETSKIFKIIRRFGMNQVK
jgi:GTP-binding protein